MKYFIKTFLIFLLPILFYIISSSFALPKLLSIKLGPSTKEQINIQFKNAISKNYDLLILGNSRTYRGLNPDIFNLSSYNFSHANDSYNQMFYKLEYVLDKGKPIKYVIINVDYFQFGFKADTRNYAYGDWLGKSYLKDYEKSLYWYKLDYLKSNMLPQKLLRLRTSHSKPFLKENGQYIKTGLAKKNDFINRDTKRLDFQEEYFEKIVEICKSQNIKLFMVMLPVRNNELNVYKKGSLKRFNTYINGYANDSYIFYLNYSELKEFSYTDYVDITHLNERGANKISCKLNKDISRILKI